MSATEPCVKKAFRSPAKARRALRKLQNLRALQHANKIEDHAYLCTACNQWHLTSQPRR